LSEAEIPSRKSFSIGLPEKCSSIEKIRFINVKGETVAVEVGTPGSAEVRLRSLNLRVKLEGDNKLRIKSGGISRGRVSEIAYICNDVENIHEKWLLVLKPAVVIASQTSINTNGIMNYKVENLSAVEYLFNILEHDSLDVAMYYDQQDMEAVGRCKNVVVSDEAATGSTVTFTCEPREITPEWIAKFSAIAISKTVPSSPEELKRRGFVKRLENALTLCIKDMRGGNSYAESALERFQMQVKVIRQVRTSTLVGQEKRTSNAAKADLLRMARVFELSDVYLKKTPLELTYANTTMERALKGWESDVKKKIPAVEDTSQYAQSSSRYTRGGYSSGSSSGSRNTRQQQVDKEREDFFKKGISDISTEGLSDEKRALARQAHYLRGERFFQGVVFDKEMCDTFSKYKYAGLNRMLRGNRHYKAICITLLGGGYYRPG